MFSTRIGVLGFTSEEKKDGEQKEKKEETAEKVKDMVKETKEKFGQKEEKQDIPSAEKLVKNLKDHVKGKEPNAEDLIKEANNQDVDTRQVDEVVKKIQKGENSADVPSAHELAQKKEES